MTSLDGYGALRWNCLKSPRGNREPDPLWPCKILKTALSVGWFNNEETCHNLSFNRITLVARLIISCGKWDKSASRDTSYLMRPLQSSGEQGHPAGGSGPGWLDHQQGPPLLNTCCVHSVPQEAAGVPGSSCDGRELPHLWGWRWHGQCLRFGKK